MICQAIQNNGNRCAATAAHAICFKDDAVWVCTRPVHTSGRFEQFAPCSSEEQIAALFILGCGVEDLAWKFTTPIRKVSVADIEEILRKVLVIR